MLESACWSSNEIEGRNHHHYSAVQPTKYNAALTQWLFVTTVIETKSSFDKLLQCFPDQSTNTIYKDERHSPDCSSLDLLMWSIPFVLYLSAMLLYA